MAASKSGLLSYADAWNSVALEERLELVSRAQAHGLTASCVALVLLASIAYGFDSLVLLAIAGGISLFVTPLFSSYTWRRGKPVLILEYLAVRSVSRRYAYGFGFKNLEVIVTFRGQMKETFLDREAQEEARSHQLVDLDDVPQEVKDVWIILLGGGFVVLSERSGGAHLELAQQVLPDLELEKTEVDDPHSSGSAVDIALQSWGGGKKVTLWSRYPGAMYVFERKLRQFIEEAKLSEENFERLRRSAP